MGSGLWTVGSGRWAVDSGKWAVGSGQWTINILISVRDDVMYKILVFLKFLRS